MTPVSLKSSESLNIFKSKIKYWTPNHCSCRICETYFGQVRFLIKLLFLFVSTIYFTYLLLKERILKILFKINVKAFNLFVFILPYNVLLYLPNNVLLYLALIIRPAFCIKTIVTSNQNKVCTKKNKDIIKKYNSSNIATLF